jgi:hypothetical protein
MEIAVERITGIGLLVIGLSHLLQPRTWAMFFARLREMGEPGALINGMMSLNFGAIIVGFHGTQWSGWPALVTFIGWAQVTKGLIHTCIPSWSLRSMASVPIEKAWKFRIAGAIGVVLAGVILVGAFQSPSS